MQTYTQGDLKIRSAVPVTDIHQFYMKVDRNDHAVCRIEGTVPENCAEDAVLQPLSGTPMMAGAGSRMLFAGRIREVQMTHEGTSYHVTVTGVSMTEQLDLLKRDRSFQDVSMTYREVMEQVAAGTPGTKLWFHGADRAIQSPLYQIGETDWEFLRRLAGRLHTVLVPSEYGTFARLHSGVPDGEMRRADSRTVCVQTGYDRRNRGTWRRVRTHQIWEIGDRIDWEGYQYIVSSKVCQLKRGILESSYMLAGTTAFWSQQYENPHLTGLMLPAVVLDIQEEQVKVRFDMDLVQQIKTAYWYPWEPEMGNLAYCMPEKGEQVYIHIGNASGGEDRAVCGVRRNGRGNPALKSTHRYFTTKDQKRLYLEPDVMGFRDLKQKKPLELKLSDEAGASVASHRSITLTAKDTIGLKGSNIVLQAPKEISLVKRAVSPTVINMCNGFDTVGAADRVTMGGGKGDQFPVFYQSEEQNDTFTDRKAVEKCVIASTPAMELTDKLERQLEGCMVKRLETSSTSV